MRRIPEITAVRAWDATRQSSYTPTSLSAGVGVQITLSGDAPRSFRRPMTPAKGKIELHRGRNLVSWLGPDNWTIDRVVMGIGRAFVKAEWGEKRYLASNIRTVQARQTVKRGDALWIEVSRRVNWLQPADVWPTIVFAGTASKDVQEKVRQDSVDAMRYFKDEFSVQPDGSLLTVYVAADVGPLIDAFEEDGIGTDGVHKSWYSFGGWASPLGHIVLKLEQWGPDYSASQQGEGDHGVGR